MELKSKILNLIENPDTLDLNQKIELLKEFIEALNNGSIRSAEKDENGNWNANIWVKQGILQIFKYSQMTDMSDGAFSFFDKDLLTTHNFNLESGVRIVPGGSTVRNGCYVAKGVICMPPMYINIGSYVDEGTMVDSHALVGTCAQIGKRVHISAAAQVGGVLEPAGANPVIIEDDVMIGGNCGIYEGVIVRKRAVLASGVILNASTKVYDLINKKVLMSENGKPLEIPEGAVVVSGSRPAGGEFAKSHNLSIYSPLIIKYRDEKTDSKTALEDALR